MPNRKNTVLTTIAVIALSLGAAAILTMIPQATYGQDLCEYGGCTPRPIPRDPGPPDHVCDSMKQKIPPGCR